MMTIARSPQSRFYDGAPYGLLVDPLLRELHQRVVGQVPAGGRVLDACCGPGGLTLALASRCAEVVGVDLSPRQIRYAERRRRRRRVDNARFEVGDVSRLADYGDDTFDAVTVVMALHEMPAGARVPVLQELARVGQRVIVVDFQIPMPRNPAGWRNRAIEVMGGPDHFRAFRDYTRRGGLNRLVRDAGLEVGTTRTMDAGTLTMQILSRRD